MQNFGSIAWKMAKLWPFEHYILYVRDGTYVRTLQQNLVANQTKSIWPIPKFCMVVDIDSTKAMQIQTKLSHTT